MATHTAGRSIMTLVRQRWIAIVLVILAAFFVAQNRERVSVDLFWINMKSPLWLVLLVLFAIGAAVGTLMSPRRRGAR